MEYKPPRAGDPGKTTEANNQAVQFDINPTTETGIYSRNSGTATTTTILRNLDIFLIYSGNIKREGGIDPQNIIPQIRELLNPDRWRMIQYYFKHGASSIWTLRYSLSLSKTKAYRLHKLIEESEVIEIKTTIKPVGKMKNTATIWGTKDCTEKQIKDASSLHLNLTSPIYRKADRITKTYINEGRSTIRLSERDLIMYLKEINEPPRIRHDLARMMLTIFSGRPKQ